MNIMSHSTFVFDKYVVPTEKVRVISPQNRREKLAYTGIFHPGKNDVLGCSWYPKPASRSL